MNFLTDHQNKELFISGHGRNIAFLRRLLTNTPINYDCKYPHPKNGELWKFEKKSGNDYYSFESLFVPE